MADKLGTVNVKEERARLTRLVKDSKARIEEELKRYRSAINNLKTAAREYDSIYTKFVAKPNPKMKEKLDAATEKLTLAYSIRNQLSERIATLLEIISRSTVSLIGILGAESGQGKAETKNLEKYSTSITKRISDIEGSVINSLPDILTKKEEAAPAAAEELYDEELAEDRVDAPQSSAGATATSVKVAPVNIDVTPMIERAISAAMAQLSDGLNARIDAYIAGVNIPTPTAVPVVAAPADADGNIAALEAHILEGEAELYEKLKTMCVTLDELIAGVAETSATYLTLMQKLREISDLQKQVNEMQRQTARDQQGIGVSQRLIADTQLEVVTQQKLVGDKQTELQELASKITESQSATLAAEQAIVASQTEIETAMKAILDREKRIIQTQETIADAATKVETTQRTIQEKQAELVAAQRETMTQQRQLQREQRSVSERQAATESTKAPKRTRKKAATETPEASVDAAAPTAEEPVITVPQDEAAK